MKHLRFHHDDSVQALDSAFPAFFDGGSRRSVIVSSRDDGDDAGNGFGFDL